MKPSEAVAAAIENAHDQASKVTALSFENFVALMATTIEGWPSDPTDSEAFHVSVSVTLGDLFTVTAFVLKATAYGFASVDVASNAPLLANDAPWVARLDGIGLIEYRKMNVLYCRTVRRVALEFERTGWTIDDTELR